MIIEIIGEVFSICKVSDFNEVNTALPYVFMALTDQEKSLVCPVQNVPGNTIIRDDGWKAFRIKGIIDFSLIGLLSDISRILCEGKVGIFVVSTYNTDYIFTKAKDFDLALSLLKSAGYSILSIQSLQNKK